MPDSFFGPTEDVSLLIDPPQPMVLMPAPEPAPGIVPGAVTQTAPTSHDARATTANDCTEAASCVHADPDRPLSSAGASPEKVVKALSALVETSFEAQQQGIARAFKALDSRPEHASSWLAELLGEIAETIVSVGIGQVAELVFHALRLSEPSTDAVRDDVRPLTSLAGQAVGGAMASAADPVVADGPSADFRADPSADRLVDEYRAQVESRLTASQGMGRAQLILSSDALEHRSATDLDRMLQELTASTDRIGRIAAEQQRDVLLGWMRICAASRLGPREPGEPQIPGANGAANADPAIAAAPGLDGFVDVFISCPETIDGTKGCKVEHAVVNSHPSVARAIKTSSYSLAALPVHRKIFIGSMVGGDRSQWGAPSLVLTPDGEFEVLPAAAALAGIGAGRPVARYEIAPWLDPNVAVPAEQRPAREAMQKQIWLNSAFAGAGFVRDLLARTLAKAVIK